jgi:O-antigen ligase
LSQIYVKNIDLYTQQTTKQPLTMENQFVKIGKFRYLTKRKKKSNEVLLILYHYEMLQSIAPFYFLVTFVLWYEKSVLYQTIEFKKLFLPKLLNMKALLIRNINFYMALAVVFFIPFPRQYSLPFIWLWILAVLVEGKVFDKARANFHKFTKTYVILFAAFVAIHLASALFSTNVNEGFKSLTPLITAFILPFILLICNDLYKKKINLLLFAFLLGNLLTLTLCVINSFIDSTHISENGWFFQASLDENLNFFESFVIGKNQFAYVNFSLFKHPSYFAMYSIFSMGILTYFARIRHIKRWVIILLLFYLFIGVYLISSRAGILTAFLYFLFSSYIYFRNKRLFLLKFPAVIIALTGALMLIFSQSRLQKTVPDKQQVSEKGTTRIELWESSLELASKHPLWGLGIADVNAAREELYAKNNVHERMFDKNSHNQYLETWLNTGIFGLIILILLLLIPFIQSIKDKNYLLTLFLFIVGFNFLFESMLQRFQGGSFIFFFLSLFLLIDPEKLKSKTQQKPTQISESVG